MHLPSQIRDVFGSLWIVLDPPPKPTQLTHSLLIIAFYISGIACNIWGHEPLPGAAIMIVAGVDIVPDSAVYGPASAVANGATLNTPVPVAEIAPWKVLSAVCSSR